MEGIKRGVWSERDSCWVDPPGRDLSVQCPESTCPFCGFMCDADWCDVGVGMIQSGPYHCELCRASEVGSYDNTDGRTMKYGWYLPESPAGTTVNTAGGEIVGHKEAKLLYEVGLLDQKGETKPGFDFDEGTI